MTDNSSVSRLKAIQQNVERLALENHPGTHKVQIIAVSKTRSADEIRLLARNGQLDFGENYTQEAIEKISLLQDLDITWHFIGPIQKNKTKQIAENFSWVHSVDREIIANRLSAQRPPDKNELNVCIQVNIDEESTKSGVMAEDLFALADHIETLPNIKLRGLMAIPSINDDVTKQYLSFEKMQNLFTTLRQHNGLIDTLSMGMSNDYPAAIKYGATMIRLGTAIFGPRQTKKTPNQ
jgi:pyridoxal phosphate enzyme (YggS family)